MESTTSTKMQLYNCDVKMIKPACHQKLLMRSGLGAVATASNHMRIFTHCLKDLLWGEGTYGQREHIF